MSYFPHFYLLTPQYDGLTGNTFVIDALVVFMELYCPAEKGSERKRRPTTKPHVLGATQQKTQAKKRPHKAALTHIMGNHEGINVKTKSL
ncbi:hypothetical protein [Pseudoalteromonas ardens]|uniref:Uncharacterized protein n=1 Tax=Pseudoalteromonas rubra TaxID=43658 RepID=A0A0L0EPZ8_9GAMM|nr:hypothetical protein [Pseudoalteromonas sp. R96]KNC66455.1 hypothetical protein AC626_16870 [Pseudoalteromonas rubra]MDK1313029.1 hypothetical protein [Pseudoalteromonas sp. R96]